MTINNNFPKFTSKIDAVSMLKVMILVAILLVPITFMLLDLTISFQNLGNRNVTFTNSALSNTNQAADFKAPVDSATATDLSNVPKEEIDTLFNNLKK